VLPAGDTLLVVDFDPARELDELAWFRAAYGLATDAPIFGPYTGALANEGEDLQLLRPDPPQLPPHPDAGFVPYVPVEHVHYRPAAPWPTNGLTTGHSLQRRVPSAFGNEPLNWFTAPPNPNVSATTDTDADGLPDYWETANGLDPASAQGASGPTGDPDGDGQSNFQEFLADTNPQQAADCFRVESVALHEYGITLTFRAAAGRGYAVFYSDASPTGPWHKLADVPPQANPHLVRIEDPRPGLPASRFYRLALVIGANP